LTMEGCRWRRRADFSSGASRLAPAPRKRPNLNFKLPFWARAQQYLFEPICAGDIDSSHSYLRQNRQWAEAPRRARPGNSKNFTRQVQWAQGSLLFLSAYLLICIQLFFKLFYPNLIPILDISSTLAVLEAKYSQLFGSAQVLPSYGFLPLIYFCWWFKQKFRLIYQAYSLLIYVISDSFLLVSIARSLSCAANNVVLTSLMVTNEVSTQAHLHCSCRGS
jgi:hypothetical protein